MLDLRIMIKFDKKENINRINCSLKENVLFNVITNEYTPIEIVYENYLNLFNKENHNVLYWNTEYEEFAQLVNKFNQHGIVKLNDLNL